MKRTAIITGATSGIGKAIAEKFVQENIQVVLTGRVNAINSEILNKALKNYSAFYFRGDLNKKDTIKKLFESASNQFQNFPNIIVVNAGIGLPGTLVNSDDSKWEVLFQTNCISAMQIMRKVGQEILKLYKENNDYSKLTKDIIVTSSIAGRIISESNPVYGATKFALTSLAESLRKEICITGTRVTVLEPGFVKSNFQSNAGYDFQKFSLIEKKIGHLLTPLNIAEIVYFIINQPQHVNISNIIIRPNNQLI